MFCIFYEFIFYEFYITKTCSTGNAYFREGGGPRIFSCMSISSDLVEKRIFKVRDSLADFKLQCHGSIVTG